MINDIKLGFKVMKYGFQYKTILWLGLVFFGLGVVFELFINDSVLGGLYLMLCSSYAFQLVITPTVSKMVCSSFAKKKLQTSIPCIFTAIMGIIAYTLYFAAKFIRMYVLVPERAVGENYQAECIMAITVIFLAIVMPIYNAVAYKKFVLGLVVMLVCLLPFVFLSSSGALSRMVFAFAGNSTNLSLVPIMLLGYAAVIVGAFISYFFTLMLYKFEMDPKTYRSAMAKAGK